MNLTAYIKKYEGLSSILRIVVIFAFVMIPKPEFLKKAFFALAIVGYAYILVRNLFSKINYKRKQPNAIRFCTSNDEYYKLINPIAGTLLILLSIIAFKYDFVDNWYIAGVGIGLLMVLNGYYFVPTGNFQLHENNIIIETQNSKNHIFPVEIIKELAFRNHSIMLTKWNEEKQSFFNLNISQKQLSAISNYLNLEAPQIESTFSYSEI
jgi:hypothetical protein